MLFDKSASSVLRQHVKYEHSKYEGDGIHHGTVEMSDGSIYIWKHEVLADGRSKTSIVCTPKAVSLEDHYQQNAHNL